MIIPKYLSDWTLESINDLVSSGLHENDIFDLKQNISSDQTAKTVASFANTRGGFVIYGVSNSREIIGVPTPELFPQHFGNALRNKIEPMCDYIISSAFNFVGEKTVFVVEIPKSSCGPHAAKEKDRQAFFRRDASGDSVPMTYEEIRLAFFELELKRSKLSLLYSELDLIHETAFQLISTLPNGHPCLMRKSWLVRYSTRVLDSLLCDAFALLSNQPDLFKLLNTIRSNVVKSNLAADLLGRMCTIPMMNAEYEKLEYQNDIWQCARILEIHSSSARYTIGKYLGMFE